MCVYNLPINNYLALMAFIVVLSAESNLDVLIKKLEKLAGICAHTWCM